MRIWIEEEGHHNEHEICARSATIGRDPRNAIVLQSHAISAFHLEIRATAQGLLARDLGSRNGSALQRSGERKQISIQPHEALAFGPDDTLFLGAQDAPVRVRAHRDSEESQGVTDETIHASKPIYEASMEGLDHQDWPLLVQLNQDLLSAASLEEVFARGLKAFLVLIPEATNASVTLFAEGSGGETRSVTRVFSLHRAEKNLQEIPDDDLAKSRLEQLMLQRVVTQRVGLLWSDHSGEAWPADPHSLQHRRSVAAAPLWVGEEVLGVVQVVVQPLVGTGLTSHHLDRLLLPAGALALAVRNAQHVARIKAINDKLAKENKALRVDLRRRADQPDKPLLIGESPSMKRIVAQIAQVAPTVLPVLVTGETGTGKELVARLLHSESDRYTAPFVACNIASLPQSLVEAELFGVVRGAFTGADADRPGLFEAADGGTLFLDEIGELPAPTQATLLRVLQESELRRVGETRTRTVDVRLVAATNRDLAVAVREGDFRQDLLFRINTVALELSPLRQRREDISLLVDHLLKLACLRQGRTVPSMSQEALKLLSEYDWPGNVRQLANELARAVALTPPGRSIGAQAFSPDLRGVPSESALDGPLSEVMPLKDAIACFEREYVRSVLLAQDGRRTHTAQLLGITRAGLHKIIRRHGIED